ncbi:MAG: molybdopterin-guanine dinucleotide biosynthesis protein [Methylophagaceae bacterium]|jgi:molybdopterin-guanine dinucleotide biosynthesis protein
MNLSSPLTVTGVILAGGQGRRMGGQDKGLIPYHKRPLIEHIITLFEPQVDELIINANRNIKQYQEYRHRIIEDTLTNFCGPLAGMLSVMQACESDFILTCPCDSPQISPQLRQRMMETLLANNADIAVAHDGDRMQPVFCLIPLRLTDHLEQFLANGDRKIDLWFTQHNTIAVDFSDQANSFTNFNHPEDIITYDAKIHSDIPILGFSAYSGTGKTTLLRQLIPALNNQGIEVAVIKHAHHLFDIDTPGKDSYEIRKAGSQQTLVASSRLMALMQTGVNSEQNPQLADLIPRLDSSTLDIILVEGFKHEPLSKIELHRPSVGKPFIYEHDDNIIAIASDEALSLSRELDQLDINDIDAIADYIAQFITHWTH